MFAWIGRIVGRNPRLCLVAWLAAVAMLTVTSPGEDELSDSEPRSLLPPDQPYSIALDFEHRAFPQLAAPTRTVLIFHAGGGLKPDHERFLERLSTSLAEVHAPKHGWLIQSSFLQPYLKSRLNSADGQAAMIVVGGDANYLTRRSITQVNLLESIVTESLPRGLSFEITGEGGLGRDLALAADDALSRTTFVTLVALLAILAVIYRAPLAALVPLAGIGVSVFGAVMVLNQLTRLGWALGTFEKTIAVVLLFGSGTDFALYWLATFREQLATLPSRIEAVVETTRRTGPAITGSAATTICGLLMLTSADLLPSFNAGRVLAVAMTVSLLAALTLVPALAVILSRVLYWPRRERSQDGADLPWPRRGWEYVARTVVTHPFWSVLICLLLFCWPVYRGWSARYTYDALGVMPPESSSARGRAIARKHFESEQLFSWKCIVSSPAIGAEYAKDLARSEELATALAAIPGVSDVWHVSQPLGRKTTAAMQKLAATAAGRQHVAPFYLATSHHALRFELLISNEPLSAAAMESCATALETTREWMRRNLPDAAYLHATGMTPYILNIKAVSDRDQVRVVTLVIAVIFVIVLSLVRDLRLSCLMLIATLIVYLAALGATELLFVDLLGEQGIDWKVDLFAFVILVAVGQDYNIFLVMQLLHERKTHDLVTAVRRAIASTGSVISSCGTIMAATLGSLVVAGLPFFEELGIVFAAGVLLDTFVVRPVFLPAAYLSICASRPAVIPDSMDRAGRWRD